MTLAEVLVTLTLIVILVSALGGLGVRLKKQSEIRLTESTLGVLEMALEQYYAEYDQFPFETRDLDLPPDGVAHEYTRTEMQMDLEENGLSADVLGPGHLDLYASSEALYYFLKRCPRSAAIIESLADRMVTGRGQTGENMRILLGGPVDSGGRIADLLRFVDAWGMPIRYAWDPLRDAFPILTSAGPDKTFDTPDDSTNQ